MKELLTFDDVQLVPKYSEVTSRDAVDTEARFTRNFNIGIPLVAAPMDTVCDQAMAVALAQLGGVGCPHRFLPLDEVGNQIEGIKLGSQMFTYRSTSMPVVGTIGATGDYQERLEKCLYYGANVILIDVAHGDHVHVKNAMRWINSLGIRNKFDVILGNIATPDAALRLQDWGADALRVGIGGGSMCETRIRTGFGIPQLAAVQAVCAVAEVPVISDGGIRYPGDAAKALAAGADTVMIGSLFAGTDEAPGDTFVFGQWPNTKVMKSFRGSASASAKASVNGAIKHVEGAAKLTEAKGPVKQIVNDIMDGIRSAMSYCGANTLLEFSGNATFVRITTPGLLEAHPHGIR